MKAITKKSKIALIFGVILVVLALGVASIVVFDSKAEIIKVQNNGTEVNASIIFKYKETVNCGRNNCTNYILSILYFDKPKANSEKLELAPDFVVELPKIQIGNSHSSTLKVSSSFYRKAKAGDRIKIAYIDADYDNVWLAENIKNWNIWKDGLWFSAVALAFLLIYLSFRFKKSEQKVWLELGLE